MAGSTEGERERGPAERPSEERCKAKRHLQAASSLLRDARHMNRTSHIFAIDNESYIVNRNSQTIFQSEDT